MDLISTPYQPGDEEGINALYRTLTGRVRGRRRFAWEWLDQPEGEPQIWLIKEAGTGEIVGQHCLMPLQLSWFGRRIMLGKTENTMMHLRFRGTGAYFPFEKRFVEEELDDRFAMLMTTWAGGAPGRIRAKLGYRRLDRWVEYLYFADRSAVAAFLGAAADRALEAKARTRRAAGLALASGAPAILGVSRFRARGLADPPSLTSVRDLDPVAEEIDAFWERNRARFGITIWRSSRYLRWRLFDNPWVEHELWLARLDGELVGYAVVKADRGHGDVAKATLVDVVVEGNDGELLARVIAGVARTQVDRGVGVVRCATLAACRPLGPALGRAGFLRLDPPRLERRPRPRIRRRPGAPVMLRVLDPQLASNAATDPRNWYFTVLFTEGIG